MEKALKIGTCFLTFDCEDFINPNETSALERYLELLRRYNLGAVFFVTGHMCEKLRSFPRILDSLEEHEIGYHSTSHSVHPSIFEYTDIENYKETYHVSLRREQSRINPLAGEIEGRGGLLLLKDLFPNKEIVAYRGPGFCWSPPNLEALKTLGIRFDFSTCLSRVPVCYDDITFYPYPIGKYGMRAAAGLSASLLVFNHAVLTVHLRSLVNADWDAIYYMGNPKQLFTFQNTCWEKTKKALRTFELFAKTDSFLAKKEVLQITPPLQEGIHITRFLREDVLRSYRRSIHWAELFNYKPKFLLAHFLKYFNIEPELAKERPRFAKPGFNRLLSSQTWAFQKQQARKSVKVTIGVVVKDSEKTIRECIDSILSQKYPKELSQIIIVDGCSKDRTLPIILSSTSKVDMQVEIYSDEGKGLGKARQIAVDHANGRYLIFVDADVKIYDDFVEKQVKLMEENPHIGIAFGRPMHANNGTLISTVWDLLNYATGGLIASNATIYRPEALRQVGGFDTNIKGAAEDKDVVDRIREKGWLLSRNEKARFFHKCRENFKDFWDEQSWFGYGDHYLSHKDKDKTRDPIWRKQPIGSFIGGLKMALKAYELTYRKISFLIPFQMIAARIAWWFGFVKGHMDGYGHIS